MILEYSSFPKENMENFKYNLQEKEFSTNPYLKILTYSENNKVVGFLLYSLIYDRIEIEQFEVLKAYQNRHIGSKLLEHLIDKYKGKNIKNITLEVKKDNLKAKNIYLNHNFVIICKRNSYYDGIDALLMEMKY